MKLHSLGLFLILILSSLSTVAQDKQAYKAYREWLREEDDFEKKVLLYQKWDRQNIDIPGVDSAHYCDFMSEYLLKVGDRIQALVFCQTAIDLRQAAIENILLHKQQEGISKLAKKESDEKTEVKKEFHSLNIAELRKRLARSFLTKATIYKEFSDFFEARLAYSRALALYSHLNDSLNAASVHGDMGLACLKLGLIDSARSHLDSQLLTASLINKPELSADGHSKYGHFFENQLKFDSAYQQYSEELEIRRALKDSVGIANSLISAAIMSYYTKEYGQTERLGLEGLEQARNIGNIALQKKVLKCLFDLYQSKRNHSKSSFYIRELMHLTDSSNVIEFSKQKQLWDLELDRINEAKRLAKAHADLELEKSESFRRRTLLLSVIAFVVLVTIGLLARLRIVDKAKRLIQKERDRSDKLLLNILPEEIANELKQKGEADARDHEHASVIFTDFKGFTELSASMSAKDLVSEINHCFKAFDHIMAKYGIEKIKTIGDAYMAVGGLTTTSKLAAKNTVLAGLAMQEFIKARQMERETAGESAFEMRCGIHTGNVVAGIVGVKKFQYDVWGDTVNTASRMESNSKAGKVNVSQSTYELLKDESDLKFEARGKVFAKGKGEIEMYFVEAIS